MARRFINAVQVLALLLWTAGWITLALLASILTFDRQAPLVMARRYWAPGVLWLAGVQLEIAPLPEIDWSRPHVFVMNHQSALDIPCAFATLPTNLRFLAKHSLAWVPFLGWYMWLTGMVFVDRGNRARALNSLKRAGVRVREGRSLLTYPEGTRSRDGELQLFKRGTFVVALEAQVPIVPIAIRGSSQVLQAGSFRIRGGVVHIKVGSPIPTAGRRTEERDLLADEVRREVSRLLETLPDPRGVSSAPASALTLPRNGR